jgi:hypothetical protein
MRYCAYPVKKGLVYTIDGFYKCPCGSDQVTLKERASTIEMICKCRRLSYRRQSYYSWRFIPEELFYNFIDLSAKKKIPEKIIVQKTEPEKEEIKNIQGSIAVGKINLHTHCLTGNPY